MTNGAVKDGDVSNGATSDHVVEGGTQEAVGVL